MNTQDKIKLLTSKVQEILLEKNKRYGDAALNPLSVFGKHVSTENNQSTNSILIRLDDKLSRVKNGDELRLNDLVDILGYIHLLIIDLGMENDLDKLID